MAETELSVGLIVLLAAAVQSATGFGYAVLAAPLLSIVLNPAEAVPMVWLTFVPAAAVVTLLLRADVCWAIGWRASLAGVPAALLGGWALADVPSRVLQALTGVSILVFTLARAPRRMSAVPAQVTDALAGAVAGILAVTTGTSGPPLVLAVSRHVLSPGQARATLAWLFTVFGLTAVTWLQLTGHIPAQTRSPLLAALPPLAAGTFLGLFLGRHLPSRLTVTATRLLLLGSALACLAKAAAG